MKENETNSSAKGQDVKESATLPQAPAPKKQIDPESALEVYSLDELKFHACENHLLGNFDLNKNYRILDIIYPELINIPKTLELRSSAYYTAFAEVEQTRLNFMVKIRRPQPGRIMATLILTERLVIGQILQSSISTPLKTIEGDDTPDFLYKVRSAFNLRAKDEEDDDDFFDDYVSPPIELVTELLKKNEMLEALKFNREKIETEYVNALLKALKATPAGTALAKRFFAMVRENNLHEMETGRIHVFKELLDFLLDEELEKNAFTPEEIQAIAEVRADFSAAAKKETFEFIQTKAKSGFKGFIGAKKFEQMMEKPAHLEKHEAKTDGAPASSPKNKEVFSKPSAKVEEVKLKDNIVMPAPLAKTLKRVSAPKKAPAETLKKPAPAPAAPKSKGIALNSAILSYAVAEHSASEAISQTSLTNDITIGVYNQSVATAVEATYDVTSGTCTVSMTEISRVTVEEIKIKKPKEQTLDLI